MNKQVIILIRMPSPGLQMRFTKNTLLGVQNREQANASRDLSWIQHVHARVSLHHSSPILPKQMHSNVISTNILQETSFLAIIIMKKKTL